MEGRLKGRVDEKGEEELRVRMEEREKGEGLRVEEGGGLKVRVDEKRDGK